MTASPTVNQTWIVSEMVRLLVAERSMSENAGARAASLPDPSLGIVYHEIAAADEKHAAIIETIATRYGHTPGSAAGGIGEAFGRFKDKVVGLGTASIELLAADLAAKSAAIHWYAAWVHTLEATGDAESAQQLAAVLAEELAHRDALQHGLNRLVEQGARVKESDSK